MKKKIELGFCINQNILRILKLIRGFETFTLMKFEVEFKLFNFSSHAPRGFATLVN